MRRPTVRPLGVVCAVLIASTMALAAQAPVPETSDPVERAARILEAARQAMGGQRLADVKTMTATGQTRRVRGNNLVPIEFEFSLELPDKYVRRDESPAEETAPTSLGFNGVDLIQVPPPAAPPARAGGPAPTPEQLAAQRRARVARVKQDFARFAIGLFPGSFETFPLTFRFAALAAAPQGTADVLDVRGPDGFAARLLIDSQTHLPVMVSWTQPPSGVIVTAPGQPPPPTVAPGAVVVAGPAAPPADASDEAKAAHAQTVAALRKTAQSTPVEHRVYFADYRQVDGVLLPFRLRRAIGSDTTEETTFDRFRLNSRIDPRRFEPVP